MALADMLPGGAQASSRASIEQEAAKLLEADPSLAVAPDPYEGTALSRESLGQAEPTIETPQQEPAPEPAPAPEQAVPESPPTLDEDGEPADPQRKVPFAALKAEREKRREFERQLYEVRGQIQAWQNAAQQQLQQMQQPGQPQQQEAPPPDPDTDPLGAVRWLQERQQRAEQLIALQLQERQAQQQLAQMGYAATQLEVQYAQQVPDYTQARDWLAQNRREELAALGCPPQQIDMEINKEIRWMVANSLQRGINPADVVYRQAKARGWKATAAGAAPAPVAATPVPAPAALPPSPAAPTKAAAAVNLPSSGRPQPGKLTPEQVLASGTVEDFDKLFAEMERDARGHKRTPMWDQRGARRR